MRSVMGILLWALCLFTIVSTAFAQKCILSEDNSELTEVILTAEDHTQAIQFVMSNVKAIWNRIGYYGFKDHKLEPRKVLEAILMQGNMEDGLKSHLTLILSCLPLLSEIGNVDIPDDEIGEMAEIEARTIRDSIQMDGKDTIYDPQYAFYELKFCNLVSMS